MTDLKTGKGSKNIKGKGDSMKTIQKIPDPPPKKIITSNEKEHRNQKTFIVIVIVTLYTYSPFYQRHQQNHPR